MRTATGTATAGPIIGPRFLEPGEEDEVGLGVFEAGSAESALVVVMRVLEPPAFEVMIEVMTWVDGRAVLLDCALFREEVVDRVIGVVLSREEVGLEAGVVEVGEDEEVCAAEGEAEEVDDELAAELSELSEPSELESE